MGAFLWRGLCADLSELVPRSSEREIPRAIDAGWRVDMPGAYCRCCGESIGRGEGTVRGCAQCLGRRVAWDRIVRLSAYAAPLDQWIVSMKFRGDWSWAIWFGQRLAERIRQEDHGERVALCPVPMHWLRQVCRGYNQAHLIATAVAGGTGWPLVGLLRRTRYTRPQTAVSTRWRRGRNVRGTYAARPFDLSGWDIWLIDDVKTSGATLTTCSRLLRRAGARRVNVAVVGVAARPWPLATRHLPLVTSEMPPDP